MSYVAIACTGVTLCSVATRDGSSMSITTLNGEAFPWTVPFADLNSGRDPAFAVGELSGIKG
jgi:hypothetical protein